MPGFHEVVLWQVEQSEVGKAGGNVIRHSTAESGGAVPFVGVAADAGGVCRSEIVVVVDVAIGAGRGDVRAG